MMFVLGWIAGGVSGVVVTLLILSLGGRGANGKHRTEPDRRGADRDAVAWQ